MLLTYSLRKLALFNRLQFRMDIHARGSILGLCIAIACRIVMFLLNILPSKLIQVQIIMSCAKLQSIVEFEDGRTDAFFADRSILSLVGSYLTYISSSGLRTQAHVGSIDLTAK